MAKVAAPVVGPKYTTRPRTSMMRLSKREKQYWEGEWIVAQIVVPS